jgi:hypothetical protein
MLRENSAFLSAQFAKPTRFLCKDLPKLLETLL